MYLALKNDQPALFREIKGLIDGEDVEPEINEEELSSEDVLAGMDAIEEDELTEAA